MGEDHYGCGREWLLLGAAGYGDGTDWQSESLGKGLGMHGEDDSDTDIKVLDCLNGYPDCGKEGFGMYDSILTLTCRENGGKDD